LLQTDALEAVWKEVSTAYGAFMRHGLPIYLGPTWSQHAGSGTPFVLCALTFDPNDSDAIRATVDRLLALPRAEKVVWILDRTGIQALRPLLAESNRLAAQVALVEGDGPRGTEMRESMDRAKVLCREVEALPDQLSMLRGANWALLEAGQVLVDAAVLLKVPALISTQTQLTVVSEHGAQSIHKTGLGIDDADGLSAWIDAIEPSEGREALPDTGGAVDVLQGHLRAWLIRRRAGETMVEVALAA
jgi:hypothetical protein